MTAQEMWEKFSTETNINVDYETWAFGDAPDRLAQLVLDGIKTGTSSLHLWYGLEKEPLPAAGEYSIILDSRDNAVCVIKTTKVYVTPFCDVSEEHAFKEGEDDRSLACWRRVHEDFFSKELQEVGIRFDPAMKVVCEEFEKVYP